MLSLERRFLERLLPCVEGRDIVDLGCGTGRWLEALEGFSPRSLVGLDSSAEMLAQAEKKLDGRAILLSGDCESAPLESSSADLILCSFALSYISNIGRFVEQVRRIARPKADIFVTDLHPETERKFRWRRGFRNGKEEVEIESQKRSLESIVAHFERRCHLRPRHHGHANQLHRALAKQSQDRFRGARIQIPIDDFVLLAAFEHRGERQDRKRETPAARLGRPWIEQDNHFVFSTAV